MTDLDINPTSIISIGYSALKVLLVFSSVDKQHAAVHVQTYEVNLKYMMRICLFSLNDHYETYSLL